MSSSQRRYGYSRGLSTAEALSESQVAALRILGEGPAGQSNRNRGRFVHGGTAESLVELGLAEPIPRSSPMSSIRYRITDTGRAILRGRERLDEVAS